MPYPGDKLDKHAYNQAERIHCPSVQILTPHSELTDKNNSPKAQLPSKPSSSLTSQGRACGQS